MTFYDWGHPAWNYEIPVNCLVVWIQFCHKIKILITRFTPVQTKCHMHQSRFYQIKWLLQTTWHRRI